MAAADDVVQVKVYCQQANQAGLNIRQVFVTGVFGGGLSDQQVADELSTRVSSMYKNWLTEAADYLGLTVQVIGGLVVNNPLISQNGTGPGLQTGNPLPKQTAGLISFRAEAAGRKGHGRMYVPFPPASAGDASGFLNLDAQARLASLAAFWGHNIDLSVGSAGLTLSPIIYHRGTNTRSSIVSSKGHDQWATQRRRSDFGRQNPLPF